MDCIFCKIIQKEIPSVVRWEDENWLAIDDNCPKASIHILVMPKKHLVTLLDDGKENDELFSGLTRAVRELTKKLSIKECKIVINNGRSVGQVIDHMHVHILAGAIKNLP